MKDITVLNTILRNITALKSAFLYDKIYCLGLYSAPADDKLYYALLEACSKGDGVMEREIITTGCEDTLEAVICDILKYDVNKPVVVLAKGENEIFLQERMFPVMQEKDIKGAVRWELEVNGPKPDNGQLTLDYVFGYVSDAVDQGYRVRMGALAKNDNMDLIKEINAAGYPFAGVAVVEASLTAMGKAVAGGNSWLDVLLKADGYRERLLLGRRFILSPRIKWNSIGAAALSAVMVFCMLAAGIGMSLHRGYIAEQRGYQHRLDLLQDVGASLDRANRTETEIARLDAELAKHKDEGIPAEALMVHLGSIITKGVALTEATANRETVNIKGSAVSYNNLTRFYKVLEKDKAFFSNGASLEKSEVEKDGQRVGFSIKGRL